ncbi:MAG: arylsulfatase [Bryobacteraceae bacterium]|jgi:arylsulfatase
MSVAHATRRQFLSTLAGAAPAFARKRDRRPNVIVLFADDMGYSDIGCYGSEIATPNIDRIGAGGIRFTQFYNNAVCCPSRASILTGLYPHQAGVGENRRFPQHPAYRGVLNDRCVTIAEVLRPAGYRTWMSGKWHLGSTRPHWPIDHGFDHYFGLLSGASNYFRLDPPRKMALDSEPFVPSGRFYMTDAFTDHAMKCLEESHQNGKPFFLYLAYTAPHDPLHAWPEDIARYRGKYMVGWDELRRRRYRRQLQLGIIRHRWALSPRDPDSPAWDTVREKDRQDLSMAVYAAMVSRLDWNIGRLLSRLQRLGMEQNTMVLFLSDNGACAEFVNEGKPGAPPGDIDSNLSYGLPWANLSNTPFRLFKECVHEGGIATPLIVRWPDRLRSSGGLIHEPGHLIDIMPTCLDAAGVPYPADFAGRNLIAPEGRSLLPLIQSGSRPKQIDFFFEHQGNRAVRRDKWKLVSKYPGAWELYDLEADRTELHSLVGQMPQQVRDLEFAHEAWRRRCGVVPWQTLTAK